MSRAAGLPILRFAALFGLLAGGIFLATRFLARPWIVVGDSMEPTLSHGDRVLVDSWTYRQRAPRAGEIVLFLGPPPREPVLLKRVTLPPSGSPPAVRRRIWQGREAVSGVGVWVRGDNDSRSLDSRSFGPVPPERILGRAAVLYWPPSRAGPIR
jgi:signal peptidase I